MASRALIGCIFFCLLAAVSPPTLAAPCQAEYLPIVVRVPYVLMDRRTGLALHLDSDRKHMSAIDRDGRVVWYRDIAAAVARDLPPIPSNMLRLMHKNAKSTETTNADFLGEIGGIKPLFACQVRYFNRYPILRDHDIAVGFGTRAMAILDPATGDARVAQVN